jgi:hypothetical protein
MICRLVAHRSCAIIGAMPALADQGYIGTGHGICVPVEKPPGGKELDTGTRTRNALLRSLRCRGERGFALLAQRWRTLRHVTASPRQDRPDRQGHPRPAAIRAQDAHLKVAEKTSR